MSKCELVFNIYKISLKHTHMNIYVYTGYMFIELTGICGWNSQIAWLQSRLLWEPESLSRGVSTIDKITSTYGLQAAEKVVH